MTNNTRKIVVLGNIDSPKIEQAIFILRDSTHPYDESDAVAEAQRIVDTYLKSLYNPVIRKKKKKQLARFFTTFLCISSAMILGAYLFSFIK